MESAVIERVRPGRARSEVWMPGVGSFVLDRPIGRGATGLVCRAVHSDRGLPVAVKFVAATAGASEAWRQDLEAEVRAMAALDHPSIVRVFDYGHVDHTVRVGEVEVEPGSAYLVMELGVADLVHTTLPTEWVALRQTLLGLLDGLAHAHARGVVHRDLKPHNVLLVERRERRRVAIGDFGIAWSLRGGRGSSRTSAGTPEYMAPEQIRPEIHPLGPWTDLYGLGCLGWWLATGASPFQGAPLLDRHLHVEPPPFRPRLPVPGGFEAWLRTLLSEAPSGRFLRAADAAHAIASLPEPTPSGVAAPLQEPSLGVVRTLATTLQVHTEPLPTDEHPPAPSGQAHPQPSMQRTLPPVPEDWHLAEPEPMEDEALRAGLGLFGLRQVPLVGRTEERDRLWAALRRAAGGPGPVGVVLVGPAGTGKSRLATWLCERAEEAGAATALSMVHTRHRGAGLVSMLSRFFQCQGFDRARCFDRVRDVLALYGDPPADLAALLTAVIRPPTEEDDPPEVPRADAGPAERRAMVRRLVRHLAGLRPVILWIDDAQWGPEAVAMAGDLVDDVTSDVPILVVLTVRRDALDEAPAMAASIEAFGRRPVVERLQVDPLRGDARMALVRRLLMLDGDVARQVAERTGGVPLFAVQLLGDWVERGLLESTEGRLRLRPGASVDLPDALHVLWLRRVRTLLNGRPESDGTALEVAALLGREVDAAEWRDACASLDIVPGGGLLDRMLRMRLAVGNPSESDTWHFVHGMLVESLERLARDEGRARDIHRACAAMLGTRSGRGVHARLGPHLLAAGDPKAAMPHLLEGIVEELQDKMAVDSAASLLDMFDRAAAAAQVSPEDPISVRGTVARAALARCREQNDRALALYERAAADARRLGYRQLLGVALLGIAVSGFYGGEDRLAELHEAREVFRELRERRREANALAMLANIRGFRQRAFSEAEALYEEHRALLIALDDPSLNNLITGADIRAGELAALQGRTEVGRERLETALRDAQRAGARINTAGAHIGLGQIDRAEGEFESAVAHFRAAREAMEPLGVGYLWTAQIELGSLLAFLGRQEEARVLLEQAFAYFEPRGLTPKAGRAAIGLALCAAAAEDWDEARRILERGAQLLAGIAPLRETEAVTAEQIARRAEAAGHHALADEALAFARSQRQALQRDEGPASGGT